MKRLVICCDGTWNHLEMKQTTNVVAVAENVVPVGMDSDGQPCLQLSFYDEGVGTASGNALTDFAEKYISGSMGFGLDHNVCQAYRFLVNNYEDGDEVYLFGFSRGAYTVRCLAGLINYAGLLRRHQLKLIKEAYELYRGAKDPQGSTAVGFREDNGTDQIAITFMGCWDTVGALGLPDKLPELDVDTKFNERFRFSDNKISPFIKHARHAIALDEKRKEFDVTLMKRGHNGQDLTQLWFAGDHGCVGGGSAHKLPLSSISLKWMCEEAQKIGLTFRDDFIPQVKKDINELASYEIKDKSLLYAFENRTVPAKAVFHASLLKRFVNVDGYANSFDEEQTKLKKRLKDAAEAKSIERTTAVTNQPTTLLKGESKQAIVYSAVFPNTLGINLEAGKKYRVTVPSNVYWQDQGIMSTAKGWNVDDPEIAEQLSGLFSTTKKSLIKLGRKGRVIPKFDWFTLVVCFDNKPDEKKSHYRVTLEKGTTFTAKKDGKLYAFANDYKTWLMDKYGNNLGWLPITVKCLG